MTSPSGSHSEPAPIEWKEIRDHLVDGLQLDPEWIVESPDQLRWQSGFLPTTVMVSARGGYEDGSGLTWIRVTAFTPILTVDEQQGTSFAEHFNARFPFGSFFWEEGALIIATSLQLNANSRGILTWFHTAVLAQATAAHAASRELFARAETDEDREFLTNSLLASDDQLGVRAEADDLLSFYANEGARESEDSLFQSGTECLERWEVAKPYFKELMSQQGWHKVVDDDGVLVFSTDDMAVGVIPEHTGDVANMYGQGLRIQCPVSPPLDSGPGSSFLNEGNLRMAKQGASHAGNLGLVRADGVITAAVFSYLPPGYLYGFDEPADLAIAVFNAAIHVTSGAIHTVME